MTVIVNFIFFLCAKILVCCNSVNFPLTPLNENFHYILIWLVALLLFFFFHFIFTSILAHKTNNVQRTVIQRKKQSNYFLYSGYAIRWLAEMKKWTETFMFLRILILLMLIIIRSSWNFCSQHRTVFLQRTALQSCTIDLPFGTSMKYWGSTINRTDKQVALYFVEMWLDIINVISFRVVLVSSFTADVRFRLGDARSSRGRRARAFPFELRGSPLND